MEQHGGGQRRRRRRTRPGGGRKERARRIGILAGAAVGLFVAIVSVRLALSVATPVAQQNVRGQVVAPSSPRGPLVAGALVLALVAGLGAAAFAFRASGGDK